MTLAQIQLLVAGLKDPRSPGVDGITSSMLKLAGPEVITDLFNLMLQKWYVPECFQTGHMTLDKKQPSLLVTGKRPLTVSSILLNMFKKNFYISIWIRFVNEKGCMGQ